ncbi:MAG TPA: flagellin [Opitutaceae bacterium]
MSNTISNASYANALFLDRAQGQLTQSIDRLSSGTNSVTDLGSSGVSTTAKLTSQNARIQAANTNVQNAMSYEQAASGFTGNIADVLSRMTELATLAKDPTKAASDISDYADEFSQLQMQLRDTIGGTSAQIGGSFDVTSPMGSFDGISLFGSTAPGTVQVGPNPTDKLNLPSMNLQTGSMLTLIQQDSAGNFTLSITDPNAVTDIANAQTQVSDIDASVGAASASLSRASDSLNSQSLNVQGTISSIQDVDVASESTKLAKFQILTQSSTAMLAQEQQDPKAILNLLSSIKTK